VTSAAIGEVLNHAGDLVSERNGDFSPTTDAVSAIFRLSNVHAQRHTLGGPDHCRSSTVVVACIHGAMS